MPATPESAAHAGHDGAKRKKGSKVHIAVETQGNWLALKVTPAKEQERAQVGESCQAVPEVTPNNVKVAWVDQGYTGEDAAQTAQEQGIVMVSDHT